MTTPDLLTTPKTFIPLTSGSKSRIFAHRGAIDSERPTLEQVTTVNLDKDEAWALVDALNHAAWTGDQSELDGRLADLPPAVAQSCTEALARCPDPRGVLLSYDGQPMTVLRRTYFTDPKAVTEHMVDAVNIGLQVVVTNDNTEAGSRFLATLLSSDAEVPQRDIDTWIAPPDGARVLVREHPVEDQLVDAFRDGRWDTYRSRAYWLWVQDDAHPNSASTEFVVEHFHQLLDPSASYLNFVETDDADEDSRGPLTPRNRFMLYTSLLNVGFDLDSLNHDWDDWDSLVRDAMPPLVRNQPREWWQQMARSADRLCEAARLGRTADLVPRTPAEEALLSLAARPSFVDWARDTAIDFGTIAVFDLLPHVPDWDDDYNEILPFLTGDADIEMLWARDMDGIEDPANEVNARFGMGDYRPRSWHRLFDSALAEHGQPGQDDVD